jgi:uncharacterized protein
MSFRTVFQLRAVAVTPSPGVNPGRHEIIIAIRAVTIDDDPTMSNIPGRIAWIAIAPVKSMALVFLQRAELTVDGIPGDRAFALIDGAGRLVNGKRAGWLATVHVDHDRVGNMLSLRFPDGVVTAGGVEIGEPVEAVFFGHRRPANLVVGPWSAAISARTGQDLRLVALDGGEGADRGPSATLISTAALGELARVGGAAEPLDRRRFRMTFGVDDVAAYAEDRWIGRSVRLGAAVVSVAGNVGRCAVTTHDPDTGRPSFDTLGVINQARGHLPSTEPLPFGVWSEVVAPGPVAVGDPVILLDAADGEAA